MAYILDKLKVLSETIAMIEEKLGIFKFIQYCLFLLAMYVSFNFTSIIENVMRIQEELAKKEHENRLCMRDDFMTELSKSLFELRIRTNADRVLYFEYHNSTENFVGIPFKYANLVKYDQKDECPSFDISKYRDINSGLISGIYDELRRSKSGIIINKGNPEFYSKHPEIHYFFSSQDGSKQQVFIKLHGVNSPPVGMIVLEWMEEDGNTRSWPDIISEIKSRYPGINALISKYTP